MDEVFKLWYVQSATNKIKTQIAVESELMCLMQSEAKQTERSEFGAEKG